MTIDIPGYKLQRTLGKGGMATVYLARQAVLERMVALKVMSRSLAEDPTFGQRFLREAKIVSQLVHPNIVTVHEVGQHDGSYYLSMEYIDGHDLRTVRKKLDVLGKIKVVEDIGRALHYAGEKGYVHRDIKPENIMFRSADNSAVLTDFGIAKAVKNDLTMTQTGTAIGTPHYMSPEQAKGKSVDHRSDLYSLGVVFFQMLTGRVPYDAETAVAIGIKHITEPLPVLPHEYESLQPILDGLLAKDPDRRYQNGLALLNDLRLLDVRGLVDAVEANEQLPTMPSNIDGLSRDELDDDARFTLEFDAVEPAEKPPRSIFPTFVALCFVVLAVLTIGYISAPSVFQPYMEKARNFVNPYWHQVRGQVDEGMDYLNEQLVEVPVEKQEVEEAPAVTEPDLKLEDREHSVESQSTATIAPVDEFNLDTLDQELVEQESAEPAESEPTPESVAPEIVENSEPQIEVVAPEVPSLEALLTNVNLLESRLKSDPQVLSSYVGSLDELLMYYPSYEPAVQALAETRADQQAKLLLVAQLGDEQKLDTEIARYEAIFPAESQASRVALFDRLDRALLIAKLHRVADAHIETGAYYEPKAANAIVVLTKIKQLSASDNQVEEKLVLVSRRLTEKAKLEMQAGAWAQAKLDLEAAQHADKANDEVVSLYKEASEALAREDAIGQALANAKQYKELGYLFEPAGASAYDAYAEVLALDPNHTEALNGTEKLVDALSVEVWALVSQAKFDDAEAKLSRPLSLLPENKRLQDIQTAVQDVASR